MDRTTMGRGKQFVTGLGLGLLGTAAFDWRLAIRAGGILCLGMAVLLIVDCLIPDRRHS